MTDDSAAASIWSPYSNHSDFSQKDSIERMQAEFSLRAFKSAGICAPPRGAR
jgi:hypothetical protein